MKLSYARGEHREATFLLGGFVAGGAVAALVTTAAHQFLQRFRQKRLSTERRTEPVAPDEVETALGEDRIQWLTRKTGLAREELLSGLRFSTNAPQGLNPFE